MKIFFGAAIQEAHNREERAAVHRLIIDAIKSCDCGVFSEHATGRDSVKFLILCLRYMMNPVGIFKTEK